MQCMLFATPEKTQKYRVPFFVVPDEKQSKWVLIVMS